MTVATTPSPTNPPVAGEEGKFTTVANCDVALLCLGKLNYCLHMDRQIKTEDAENGLPNSVRCLEHCRHIMLK